ncbi:hypothetical protein, partial [Xenorhabdus sp. Sc-CR9]|uniref:hypothetical protein n=1 Tax=Xenorhabdus sp. Sc-CR9 TaxID=2584468 RepID=UPI001F16341D
SVMRVALGVANGFYRSFSVLVITSVDGVFRCGCFELIVLVFYFCIIREAGQVGFWRVPGVIAPPLRSEKRVSRDALTGSVCPLSLE